MNLFSLAKNVVKGVSRTMVVRFDDQVAIVTGAGNGLGRAYALLFGSRGAKVVVNDLGVSKGGEGADSRPADNVVNEIRAAGGIAVPDYHSVEEGAAIVKTALENFGRIDIVVNNAGILRDKSFARMSDQDWDLVHAVHLRGTFLVTRAAFPYLKEQKFGRIIVTSSTSGIYGNFGQANYSAAKLGLHGFCQTVAREGARSNVYCNTVAPMGGTRLTEGLMPPDLFQELKPELIAPLVAWLCHKDCEENGALFEAAAGWFGKYRFQRSRGAVLRGSLNELVSPESIRDNWNAVTSFDGATCPQSNEEVAGLLTEVLEDLREKDERRQDAANNNGVSGPAAAIGLTQGAMPYSYTARDVILYALGVGVSTRDADYLQYLYEGSDDFSTLPTFSIIAAQKAVFEGNLFTGGINGYTPNLAKLLHGEQYVEIHKPLPASGATVFTSLEVEDVLDKGSGAVIILKSVTRDSDDDIVATCQWVLFIVGDGNFGGKKKSEALVPMSETPIKPPQAVVEQTTSVDQAALYRLSGDGNPIHIDPTFAAMGGFKEPILHGLCSLGHAVRAVINTYCPGRPDEVVKLKVRFSKPVIPGHTLMTEMWQDGRRITFRTSVKETGEVCLAGGWVELSGTPQQPASSSAPKGSNAGVSEVFQRIAKKVSDGGAPLAAKVKAVFLFNVTEDGQPAETWTVDLRASRGAVYEGTPRGAPADVSLTTEAQDLVSIASGSLNPQKAFLAGKLKVKGNIMVTQKLKDLFENERSKM